MTRPLDPELVSFIASARKAGAARFTLRQIVAGYGDQHVTQYDAGAYPNDRELGEAVWARGARDATAFAGVTTYFLCAVRAGEETYFDRHPFRIASAPIDGLRPSEEPNAVGLVAQAMRHSEAMALQYTEATAESIESLKGIVVELRKLTVDQAETIRKLSHDQLDVLLLKEKFLSQEHVRALETRRTEAEEKRQEWASQLIGTLVLPMLQAKYLTRGPAPAAGGDGGKPRKGGPPSAPVDPAVAAAEAAVFENTGALIASLQNDRERLTAIWNAFSPEQRELLSKVIQAMGQRAQAISDADERAAAAHAGATANGAASS